MKNKGFTLVEILGSIFVITILALITAPIALNLLEKSKKEAFEKSIDGIVDAVRIHNAKKGYMQTSYTIENGKITDEDGNKVAKNGGFKENGIITISEDGDISFAISGDKWCAVKEIDDKNKKIGEPKDGKCEILPILISDACFTANVSNIPEIIEYKCTDTEVIIPTEIQNIKIKRIGENVFNGKQLTKVTIPDGITSIGTNAFSNNSLTSIIIPDTVKTIGMSAFSFNQISNAILPKGITKIDFSVFLQNSLTTIEIPSSVTNIEGQAFMLNPISTIVLPEGLTHIGSNAFATNRLMDLQIPNTVTSIGDRAFTQNRLTSLQIPNSVKQLGEEAFSENQLESVTLSEGLTTIGMGAFAMNTLKSITVPSSVTSIGENAFVQRQNGLVVTVNKNEGSISGSPWGATSVQWNG